eukprot:scaffold295063_cov31-Tisochrysis_lutea.AAC.5
MSSGAGTDVLGLATVALRSSCAPSTSLDVIPASARTARAQSAPPVSVKERESKQQWLISTERSFSMSSLARPNGKHLKVGVGGDGSPEDEPILQGDSAMNVRWESCGLT